MKIPTPKTEEGAFVSLYMREMRSQFMLAVFATLAAVSLITSGVVDMMDWLTDGGILTTFILGVFAARVIRVQEPQLSSTATRVAVLSTSLLFGATLAPLAAEIESSYLWVYFAALTFSAIAMTIGVIESKLQPLPSYSIEAALLWVGSTAGIGLIYSGAINLIVAVLVLSWLLLHLSSHASGYGETLKFLAMANDEEREEAALKAEWFAGSMAGRAYFIFITIFVVICHVARAAVG